MAKIIKLCFLVGCVASAAIGMACGRTGAGETEKHEKDDEVEWNVSVHRAVQFTDSLTGVSTDAYYTVADTAAVNEKLRSVRPENLTLGWTVPWSDGVIFLVAYENEPVLSGKVKVTEVNSISSYGGDVQVAFKFPDADKWAEITRKNIGKRLAIFVNGQLMSAPQVNTEIEHGNCSVTIPASGVRNYLPDYAPERVR